MKKIMIVMGLVCSMGLAAMGGDLTITSFPGNGMLAWSCPTNGVTSYRVEWASQADGPYANFAGAAALLDAMAPTGATMAAAVPMFYRVVAAVTNPPAPAGMVLIPGGTNAGTDPDFGAYSLTVSAFYMDRTEVTKAQWDEVYTWALAHGYGFDHAGSGKASDHPVQTVNWYDSVKWCNARSEKEGRPVCYRVAGVVYRSNQEDAVTCDLNAGGYRLPTEVEWEYAARGGVSSQRFPWGDTIDHGNANYYGYPDSYYYDTGYAGYDTRYNDGVFPYTAPAGSFAANGYGLYDIAGNVWEWCFDWFPGSEGYSRVIRGGGWLSYGYYCRSDFRNFNFPVDATSYAGFRAVAAPPSQ